MSLINTPPRELLVWHQNHASRAGKRQSDDIYIGTESPVHQRAGYSRSDTHIIRAIYHYVVATPQQPLYQLDLRVLGVSSLHVYSNTRLLPTCVPRSQSNRSSMASKTSVYQELLIAIECRAIISTILIRRVQI